MLALFLCCLASLAPPEFTEYHVIGGVGERGRTPAHTDAVEHLLVTGAFAAPSAGDTITLPDGSLGTWAIARPEENGVLQDDVLRGGYAHAIVEAEESGPMILDARGHSLVYVNGIPRAGDPYSNGLMRIPVELRKGPNEFLFRVGRGRLKAELLPPPRNEQGAVRTYAFMNSDDTVPDLVVNKPVNALAGILVANFGSDWIPEASLLASGPDGEEQISFLGPIPPMSVRKVPLQLKANTPKQTGPMVFTIALLDPNQADPIDERTLTLNVVEPSSARRVTFPSKVDSSVQYYGLVPANPSAEEYTWPGILLSLHGAGVDAFRQASCYQPKSFAHVVAPSNRRPFGFDWEDWGRRDALEALTHAQKKLSSDPRKQWLTGHSMGGHGTWQIAAQNPDLFAAIAPSAGWVSFYSYGTSRPQPSDDLGRLLARAAAPSDTLLLKNNYARHGIYILHGDEDDNVPVKQARTMREELADHPDLLYHEQPGAGHWWGNQCMDWPELVAFLPTHTLSNEGNDGIDFTTVDPGISARHDWVEIHAQETPLEPSRVVGTRDQEQGFFTVDTENVSQLRIYLDPSQGPWNFIIDGQIIDPGTRRALIQLAGVASFARQGNQWKALIGFRPTHKSPGRAGMFKNAFDRNMVFVAGTSGNADETKANIGKAILDAETFRYRGNGNPEVIRDVDFDAARYPERNIILYGNADTNSAWNTLLAESPVWVDRNGVTIDGQRIEGEDLAVLLVRPDHRHLFVSIGAVAGTSPAAMRLTEQLPYFVSGVHYPDFTVFSPDMLLEGEAGIRAAGFFGTDWSIEDGEFEIRELTEGKP